MSSVHPGHTKKWFLARHRHLVLSSHKPTFESVAFGFELVVMRTTSVVDAIADGIDSLRSLS